MEEYRVHIDKERFPWETKIYIRRIDGSGHIHQAKAAENGAIVWEAVEPGELKTPFFSTDDNAGGFGLLRALAAELTRLGIKPQETEPVERELAATKYHLEDMREIAKARATQHQPDPYNTEKKSGGRHLPAKNKEAVNAE